MKLPQQHAFLERFFAADNRITWPEIINRTLKPSTLERLEPWLDDVINQRFPVILPRVYQGGMCWYALTDSDTARVELGELLTAHVGASYTDFDKQPYELSAQDPVESAIIDTYGDARTCKVYRFSATSREHIDAVFTALGRLRCQLAQRPALKQRLVRHRGRILRDINLALYRRDGSQAMRYLTELRRAGGIGDQNELFLELRSHALAGEWQQIMEHPDLRIVLDLPRPRALTEALMEAVYGYQLLTFEVQDDLSAQREFFQSTLAKRLQGLFLANPRVTSASAVKSSLLWLLSDTEAKPESVRSRAEQLAKHSFCPSEGDRRWIERLLAEFPEAQTPARQTGGTDEYRAAPIAGPSSELLTHVDYTDFDRLRLEADDDPVTVLEVLGSSQWEGTPAIQLAALALKCAWAVSSSQSAHQAQQLFERLDEDERGKLLVKPAYAKYLGAVSAKLSSEACGIVTWHDWLQQLLVQPDWNGAKDCAEDGAEDWPDTALDSRLFSELVIQCGDSANEQAAQVVRECLPCIAGWLFRHESATRWQPVWLALIELLSLDEQSSSEDMIFATDLARGYLQGTVTAEGYGDLIDYLCELQTSSGSGTDSGDIWLDMLELFVLHPCPQQQKRDVLFASVYSAFCANASRYKAEQWGYLVLFAKEAGLSYTQPESVFEDEQTESTLQLTTTLNGKKIGLYTLTESVAKRVKKQLEEIYPQVDVHINSDKTSTKPLKALAKEADLFVFAWLSAAHQAYYAIKDARGNKPLLQPRGKGSSSMLRCLLEYAQQSSEAINA
ncbi:hypothetical protein Fbal_3237 [Ferrimonas balearica DSM 9799]|uniref:Uncharacterized protein n=1 Tax=Ferrimonas balearica (strain DSM 9799 / CCM 4581 / KCTC 23876 / PAT) TaxID=550540 RepID=E1SVY5_FERBD|nr:protein DpdD [Ferrimonas balearica]ADN77436.1 hypothetical protein Fbal_3237 [Ferrimonas balearica DSM 9799]